MKEIMRDKKTERSIAEACGEQKKSPFLTLLAHQPGLKMSPKLEDAKKARNFHSQLNNFYTTASSVTGTEGGRWYYHSLFPFVDELYGRSDKAGSEKLMIVLTTILADCGWLFPEARCVSEEKRSDEYRIAGGLQFQNESDISQDEGESGARSRLLDALCDALRISSIEQLPHIGGIKAEDYLHYVLSVLKVRKTDDVPKSPDEYWEKVDQALLKRFPTLASDEEPTQLHSEVFVVVATFLKIISRRYDMVLQDRWIFENEVTESDHKKMKDSQKAATEIRAFWKSDRQIAYSTPDLRNRLISSIAQAVPQASNKETAIPIQLVWQGDVLRTGLPQNQKYKSAYRQFFSNHELGIKVEFKDGIEYGSEADVPVQEAIIDQEKLKQVRNSIEENSAKLAELFRQYYGDKSVKIIDRFKTVYAYSIYHYERAEKDDIPIPFEKYDLAPCITFLMFINCRRALITKKEREVDLEEMFKATAMASFEETEKKLALFFRICEFYDGLFQSDAEYDRKKILPVWLSIFSGLNHCKLDSLPAIRTKLFQQYTCFHPCYGRIRECIRANIALTPHGYLQNNFGTLGKARRDLSDQAWFSIEVMDPYRNLMDLRLPNIRDCVESFRSCLQTEEILTEYLAFLKQGHSAEEHKEYMISLLEKIIPDLLEKAGLNDENDEKDKSWKQQLEKIDMHYSARNGFSVTYKNRVKYTAGLKLMKMEQTIQLADLKQMIQRVLPRACQYFDEYGSEHTTFSTQDVMDLLEELPDRFYELNGKVIRISDIFEPVFLIQNQYAVYLEVLLRELLAERCERQLKVLIDGAIMKQVEQLSETGR